MEDVESHPIPQDVTGFQFKIIGDMTVKQFSYLSASAVAGWIFYQFLPDIPFIRLPLALCVGGIGPALAFLPIGGRPMDMMIFQFIKALFKPTRFLYQKTGGNVWLSTVTSYVPKPQTVNVHMPIAPLPDIGESNAPLPTPQAPAPAPTPILQDKTSPARIVSMYSTSLNPQIPSVKPDAQKFEGVNVDRQDSLKKKVLDLEKDLDATKKEKMRLEHVQSNQNPTAPQESSGVEKQLQEMLMQKEALTKQLIALQQKLDMQKKDIYSPTMATQPTGGAAIKAKTLNVKQIPKDLQKNVGLAIAPESPNIIAGIIKDPRGNPLGNILVEVKDKEGNPVRAFKTNGLGQFISATALANGDYTVLFEDPKGQNKFDAIEFKANGEVILPIEATSIDTREELRKSLFGEN